MSGAARFHWPNRSVEQIERVELVVPIGNERVRRTSGLLRLRCRRSWRGNADRGVVLATPGCVGEHPPGFVDRSHRRGTGVGPGIGTRVRVELARAASVRGAYLVCRRSRCHTKPFVVRDGGRIATP
jgi:hypothetical protein